MRVFQKWQVHVVQEFAGCSQTTLCVCVCKSVTQPIFLSVWSNIKECTIHHRYVYQLSVFILNRKCKRRQAKLDRLRLEIGKIKKSKFLSPGIPKKQRLTKFILNVQSLCMCYESTANHLPTFNCMPCECC